MRRIDDARNITRSSYGDDDTCERPGDHELIPLDEPGARGSIGKRQHGAAGHLRKQYRARFELEAWSARAIRGNDG